MFSVLGVQGGALRLGFVFVLVFPGCGICLCVCLVVVVGLLCSCGLVLVSWFINSVDLVLCIRCCLGFGVM